MSFFGSPSGKDNGQCFLHRGEFFCTQIIGIVPYRRQVRQRVTNLHDSTHRSSLRSGKR